MNDPKLSDFTPDQLQLLLNLVTCDMQDSAKTLDEIHERELASILRDKVKSTQKRIADLRVLTVQIMNAISTNKVREVATSN
jgi:hypothetical protein